MDDLEKRAREEAEKHQDFSNRIANWVIDPLIAVTMVISLVFAVANSHNSKNPQKPPVANTQEELRYNPIQSVQQPTPHYQVETQNSKYFPERPQI